MTTLLARLRVHPGKEADFERTVRPLWAATHQLEPACRRYEYWRGQEPGVYYCLLSFDDFVGFMTGCGANPCITPRRRGFFPAAPSELIECPDSW